MDSGTRARLIDLNQDFYTRFGASFSATRHRLQPGVHRVLEMLQGDESILDLGCGNGELARELAKRGHGGEYLGVDFSLPLLREAASQPEGMAGAPSARFMEVDLTRLSVISDQFSDRWSLVTAFAALHHIPGHELRLKIFKEVRQLLKPD